MSRFNQKRFMSQMYRKAFRHVIAAHNEIRASIGQPGAIDYSRITGGQGVQFTDNGTPFRLQDFTIDVLRAAQEVLDTHEMDLFLTDIQDQDLEPLLQVQSVQFLRFQEKLGKVFYARRLYPVSDYFKVVKK